MDLRGLRKQIDEIDDTIMELIFKRLLVSMDIGLVKKENNRQVYDGVREQEIHDNIAKKIQVLTDKSNINTDHKMLEESFEDIFKLILDRSKKIQKEI